MKGQKPSSLKSKDRRFLIWLGPIKAELLRRSRRMKCASRIQRRQRAYWKSCGDEPNEIRVGGPHTPDHKHPSKGRAADRRPSLKQRFFNRVLAVPPRRACIA